MKVLSFLFFLLILSVAEAQECPSFHLLHVSMSRHELERVIRVSGWDYMDGQDSGKYLQQYSLVPHGWIAEFGRSEVNGVSYTFKAEDALINVRGGVVVDLMVNGVSYGVSGIDSLRGSIEAAENRLARDCGSPTSREFDPKTLTVELLRRLPVDSSIIVCQWSVEDTLSGIFMTLTGPDTASCSVVIMKKPWD